MFKEVWGVNLIKLSSDQLVVLDLLKASLFQIEPIIPSAINWNNIFEISKSQSIIALIEPLVPQEEKNKWFESTCQIKAHFLQVLYEQNVLRTLLFQNNIPNVIIKGTSASRYYPVPVLRTMGDVDYYVSEKYYEEAKRLMCANDYCFVSEGIRHCEFIKNNIVFELHRRIGEMESPYYKDFESLIVDGFERPENYKIMQFSFDCLPPYENGLVLLWHVMHHIIYLGVGLRQLVDWMMFVENELDDIAWNKHFKDIAYKAGLDELAKTLTLLCKKWLGLQKEITWCNDADEDLAARILERAFYDGNFGHDRPKTEDVKERIRKDGLITHLQKSGLSNWKLAKRYAFFKPFAWLYQIFRYLIQGVNNVFKGNKVFRNEKPTIELKELLDQLESNRIAN